MLCLLRKVLLSIGVSMLDGCGMGSHIRTAQVRGGSLKPHSPRGGQLLHIFSCPVQCSTYRQEITRGQMSKTVHFPGKFLNAHRTLFQRSKHQLVANPNVRNPKILNSATFWPSSWQTWGLLCAPWWWLCISSSWRNLFQRSSLCLSCQSPYLEHIKFDTVR